MTEHTMKSLHIPEIRKSYSETSIINLFWKFGIGNVDRVDFEQHPTNDEFNIAYVYLSKECREWNFHQLYYNTEDSSYTLFIQDSLFQNQEDKSSDRFITFYKNHHPTPYANTKLNIHQLFQKNVLLEDKIRLLEEQVSELSKKPE